MRVFVLDSNKNPLMPCHPARARILLKRGRAAVYRLRPFTIILKERNGGETQEVDLRLDPGSKTTGMALVGRFQSGDRVIWAGELNHRGHQVREALAKRRSLRNVRRYRKTRYRKPRFMNRTRPSGWLPPSLMSRVSNVLTWTERLTRYAPVTSIQVETVRFDTQSMQNPEISGVEYQQGTLFGYEVREYLLEKWGHRCAYCDASDVPLEIDHVVPRSKGGSNRVSNLVIACHDCNQRKGNMSIKDFLIGQPDRLKKIMKQLKQPLHDAAAINATRYAIGNALKSIGKEVTFWSGGRTKWNRTSQGYIKSHWIDAACVGERGSEVHIDSTMTVLTIEAMGRGKRQVQAVDKYGFPRSKPKAGKRFYGFQTGDYVKAKMLRGKNRGVYRGFLRAVRASGTFTILSDKGKKVEPTHKYVRLLQRFDGYKYGILRMPTAAVDQIMRRAA